MLSRMHGTVQTTAPDCLNWSHFVDGGGATTRPRFAETVEKVRITDVVPNA